MKKKIVDILQKAIGTKASFEVSVPEKSEFGHYSTNLALRLAKAKRVDPLRLAKELVQKILRSAPKEVFQKIEAAPPGFINFWLRNKILQQELQSIYKKRESYGQGTIGKGKTVIVEYSQPNIAKRMHVGHLRTTILGDALANTYAYLGYKVVRWNYYGDWGTQFGNLIVAYKLWGSESAVKKNPIQTLLDLYVKFHDEVKVRPELEEKGRKEFQKLETGDRENRKLWKWFKKESLKEFNTIYKTLGVQFDVELGESFFEEAMKPLVAELKKKNIAEESQGSLIIPLDQFKLPPALIQKSDGASLYLTRDIANLEYRLKKYKPAKLLYVVGNEQTLHFQQLFAIAEILGLAKHAELFHVKYGLVRAESGKKFRTREGKVVFLEDVIQRAIRLARETVDEKNPALSTKEKEKVARAVGIGALKYTILKENRHSDIVFDWKRMLDLRGDSAPYLQYTYARLQGILRKARKFSKADVKRLESEHELALIRKLIEFPDVVEESVRTYATNNIAQYLYRLAVLTNRFYETTPVLQDEDMLRRNARLLLVHTAGVILEKGLLLLGITVIPRI